MSEGGGTPSLRDELAELAAAVRAYVEWQVETGATGLPVAPRDAHAAVTEPHAPHAAPPTGPAAFVPPSFSPALGHAGAASGPRPQAPPEPRHAGADPRPQAPPAEPRPFAPPAPEVRAAASAQAERRPAAPSAPPAPRPAASPDERRTRLALIAETVRSCTRCVLHEQRTHTAFSRGDPFSELCFIGEGPGGEEDAQGIPFVGPAGQLLDRMIAAMGYRRDEVYICNVVKCRPPSNRKPEPAEMATCTPYLAEQVALVQPKVIVALGATAVQGLLGTSEGITRLRGKWKAYKGSIPVMPTFHPAYLLRTPAAKREVWSDLQQVMKHLGKAPPGRG